MADETTQTTVTTFVCPFCSELFEVNDVRLLLLAHHLSELCPETVGILHDG